MFSFHRDRKHLREALKTIGCCRRRQNKLASEPGSNLTVERTPANGWELNWNHLGGVSYFSFCFRTQCEAGRGWWQAREAYPEIPLGLRARLTFDRTAAAWQHAAAPSADSAGQSQINVLTSRECLSLKVDTRRFDRAEAGGKKVNRWVVERAHSWHHFLPPLSVYLRTGWVKSQYVNASRQRGLIELQSCHRALTENLKPL